MTDINIGLEIFMFFWTFLDLIFIFIDNMFRSIFNAIPGTAMPFLIGIFCYSISATFMILIDKQDEGSKRVLLKAFYRIFLILVTLFVVWRFGIVMMIEEKLTIETLSEFFINLVYISFAMVLFVIFYRKIIWIKKILLILMWSIFLLLTFVICPALGESELSDTTLYQVLLISVLFIIPNSFVQYKKASKKEAI